MYMHIITIYIHIFTLTSFLYVYYYVNVLLSVYDVGDDGAWLWWLVWLLDVNTGLLSIVGKYSCMYMHIITIYIHIFTLTSFLYMYYYVNVLLSVYDVGDNGGWLWWLVWLLDVNNGLLSIVGKYACIFICTFMFMITNITAYINVY